ncbi:MAG TPA: alpha/beta hydrolase, partial [Pseudoxanthomonas sp.]|nr:alpha/beta hydrolase [Pseudoxanthomonas sp.]
MRPILFVAATALLAIACAPQAQARKLGSLDFKACSLSTPFSGTAIAAQCAVLQVPENPAAPAGRKIGLKIAWIPADRDDAAEPDPVFMLAGGPGQSATETYPQAASAFDETRKKRHLILVDQRGTGGSNALSCKEPFDESELPTPQAASDYTKRCLASLSKRADPRF